MCDIISNRCENVKYTTVNYEYIKVKSVREYAIQYDNIYDICDLYALFGR